MSCPVLAGLALAELAELADQFSPPDPAPPILVKLVETIEQAGEVPADWGASSGPPRATLVSAREEAESGCWGKG